MSIRSLGVFVTGLAVLATTAYFVRKNFFQHTTTPPSPSTISSQAVISCSNSKKIKELINKVETSTKLDSAYSITLPLLAAAYSHNRVSYETWKNYLLNAFSIDAAQSSSSIARNLEKDASQNAWILGRLLVASMLMNDKDTSQTIAGAMKILLKQSTSIDRFAAWAWGYLGIYYAEDLPKEFPAVKQKMLDNITALSQDPQEKGKDNVSWAIVMALQSVDTQEEYNNLIQDLITFTDSSSADEALQKIPPEDFLAWAISLILEAAKKWEDKDLVESLSKLLPQALESSPSDADKMLGLLISCHS